MSRIRNLVYFKIIQPLIHPQGSGNGIGRLTGPEKKIAFYCSSEIYSGTELNIIQLIEWLRERGLNVLLFTSATSPIASEAKEKKIEIIYVEPSIRYFDFKNARSVARLLRKLKIKILFIGTTRDIDIGSLIKGSLLPEA